MRLFVLALFSSLLLALAGCATVTPGMTRDEVLSTLGRPTAELERDGIHRLQFSRQPMGQSVVMVDLNSSGRVVQSQEVMNPSHFYTIDVSGTTTQADILWAFGPPATVDGVMAWNGKIWSYRWKDIENMWFWVYFDPSGVVRRVQQGPDLPLFRVLR
ncbi:MAG: hypothetical protein ABIP34_12545 [Rhodoferax sp.]|uniref:hypothetical protein n=1 Tax=Rhodoferax sp. TaxID=50421 RepID=UPI003265BB16